MFKLCAAAFNQLLVSIYRFRRSILRQAADDQSPRHSVWHMAAEPRAPFVDDALTRTLMLWPDDQNKSINVICMHGQVRLVAPGDIQPQLPQLHEAPLPPPFPWRHCQVSTHAWAAGTLRSFSCDGTDKSTSIAAVIPQHQ